MSVTSEEKALLCGSALERLANYIELGQQDDALLLVGIGAGNHDDAAFRFALIVGHGMSAGMYRKSPARTVR